MPGTADFADHSQIDSLGVTVSDVISDLGGLVDVYSPHQSALARRTTRVVFHDPESPQPLRPGDVVLAAGTTTSADLHRLCEQVSDAGGAAVVTRISPNRDPAVVLVSESSDLPLIYVRPTVTWERLYSLLQASLGSRAWLSTDADGSGIRLGDMFEFAGALSQLVGGPTILEDAYFRVIAYSAYSGQSDWGRQQAILARQIPPTWLAHLREQGILRRLRNTDDVIRLPTGPGDSRPRLITSVRSDQELIGIIWVSEGDRPLDVDAEQRLREGRTMAPPHFLRFLSSDRVGDLRRGELLRVMLGDTSGVPRAAKELQLDLNESYCLVAIEDGARAGIGRRDLMSALLESYDAASAVAVIDGTIFGLVRARGPADLARLKEVTTRCATQVAGRSTVIAAISSPRSLTDGVDSARAEIDALVHHARRRADSTVVLAGWELDKELLLDRAETLLRTDGRFVFGKVQALEKSDARRGSELTSTLASYLFLHQEVTQTAAALHVHPTTIRYRLQRIADIGRIDLDDSAECLACLIHLLAHGYLPLSDQIPNLSSTTRPERVK